MVSMQGRSSNASLIRVLCGSSPCGAGFAPPKLIAALLAFPAALLMDPVTEILTPPRLIAIVMAPGRLIATISGPNPQVIGHFLNRDSGQPFPAFAVNLLYWFLIFFGVCCCVAGLRKLKSSESETGAGS
jgi:hypothetical protein